MGLIARHVEAAGIPTLSFSSAWSITRAVNPPRAVYLDYPLGHTTGKPDDAANQDAIMSAALSAMQTMGSAGSMTTLDFTWQADDSWKDRVMRPRPANAQASARSGGHADDRVARHSTPQYQSEEDAALADPACPTCIFPQA